jgi:hypothetical protein
MPASVSEAHFALTMEWRLSHRKRLFDENALPSVLAKRFIQNPNSTHQVSNPTNVLTQPAP